MARISGLSSDDETPVFVISVAAELAGKPVFVHPGPEPRRVEGGRLPAWWAPVVGYTAQLQAAWWGWHAFGGREPLLTVVPGTVVELSTEDCFAGNVHGVDDLPSEVCTFPYLNPVTGPIYVEGAEPGDQHAHSDRARQQAGREQIGCKARQDHATGIRSADADHQQRPRQRDRPRQ